MTAPRIARSLMRLLTMVLVGGFVLGLLPPVLGGSTPPTVVREKRLDVGRLVPASSVAARTASGVSLRRAVWTEPTETCAPITFTAVAFTWRQDGDASIEASLSWGSGAAGLEAEPDEGPDPGSEDDHGIVGTPLQWTGEARCVDARFRLPARTSVRDLRAVFINTSGTASGESALGVAGEALAGLWGMAAPDPAVAKVARPGFITRREWGADESLRSLYCDGQPDYADRLKVAYVHHTAGSNTYSRSESDDVVRAIYSYHVRGRHYCDIAYNFLVDRFGRIYEGRYGGVSEPVIGGHASGFNTGSTGVVAMGDFTTKRPSRALRSGLKRVLAWRLDVAHLPPTGWNFMESGGGGTSRYDEGQVVRLRIITGHRDTSYTSCPGGQLYKRLPILRRRVRNFGGPKIWNPQQIPGHITPRLEKVQWVAKLSGRLSWTLRVRDKSEALVRRWDGSSDRVAVGWRGVTAAGKEAPPGFYTVTLTARRPGGGVARPASFKLRIDEA
jgi:hypothetical protein